MARKTRRAGLAATTPGRVVNGRGRSWVGYVAVGLACVGMGAGGTYLALRPALRQAATSRGVTAQAARDLGNWYEDHQQWPQAVSAYTQALAGGLDPTDVPDVRTDLGVAYFQSNQPGKALDQYRLAQTQNPQHENSLFNEGSAYAVLGDGPHAISTWRLYLQRFPQGQHVAQARQFIATVQTHPLVTPGAAKP